MMEYLLPHIEENFVVLQRRQTISVLPRAVTASAMLVRNLVPKNLAEGGVVGQVSYLKPEECLPALQQEIQKEMSAFEKDERETDKIGRLANMVELVHAMAKLQNIALHRVECARLQKRRVDGGYEQFISLKRVT